MSYAPSGESADDLWLERSNFAGGFLGGVFYGIHAVVAGACLYVLLSASGKKQWPLIAFVAVLFAVSSVLTGTNTKWQEMMFIDYRDYPGGPNGFFLNDYSIWVNTAANSLYIVQGFMVDGLLLVRCGLFWNYSVRVMIFPTLLYLASTAMSIMTIFQSAQPNANIFSAAAVDFAIPYWSLSIALNIIITGMIATRMIVLRRRIVAVLGADHARTYTSIVALLTESAALYSTTMLVFVITYGLHSNALNIVLPISSQVMCIAPELIILRVGIGRAFSSDTVQRTTASLKFANSQSDNTTLALKTLERGEKRDGDDVSKAGSTSHAKSWATGNGSRTDF